MVLGEPLLPVLFPPGDRVRLRQLCRERTQAPEEGPRVQMGEPGKLDQRAAAVAQGLLRLPGQSPQVPLRLLPLLFQPPQVLFQVMLSRRCHPPSPLPSRPRMVMLVCGVVWMRTAWKPNPRGAVRGPIPAPLESGCPAWALSAVPRNCLSPGRGNMGDGLLGLEHEQRVFCAVGVRAPGMAKPDASPRDAPQHMGCQKPVAWAWCPVWDIVPPSLTGFNTSSLGSAARHRFP